MAALKSIILEKAAALESEGPLDTGYAHILRAAHLEGIKWGDLPDDLFDLPKVSPLAAKKAELAEAEGALARAPSGRWRLAAQVEQLRKEVQALTPQKPKKERPPPGAPKKASNRFAALEFDD